MSNTVSVSMTIMVTPNNGCKYYLLTQSKVNFQSFVILLEKEKIQVPRGFKIDVRHPIIETRSY